jgi:Uma2 family endonuclease
LPNKRHAIIQNFLLIRFAQLLPKSYRSLPELNVLCGADRIVPDITVFRRGASFIDGDLANPPALVIEIASPGQTSDDLKDKCFRLVRSHPSAECWIILPEKRQAGRIFGQTVDLPLETEAITSNNLPDGLSVSLAEMWAALDED